MEDKWTEDKTVLTLNKHLNNVGWSIIDFCIGHKTGTDIIAEKKGTKMHIEVKGAKGSKNSHVTTRKHFSKGQIRTHFGVAIVKALSLKLENPNDRIVIAHPNDNTIRGEISKMTPLLKGLNIEHFWVNEDNFEID